jgi:1-acyl-sn-glycerol-3-phosphate acyltransferase
MRALVRRAVRILVTGSAFVLFFAGGALLSYVAIPLARLGGGTEAERGRRARRVLGAAWAVFHHYMRLGGLLRYDPRRVRLDLPAGPFVAVANHPTLVDVTAIVAAHPEMVCVAKRAMFRSPLVGRLLRTCGHVEAGDGSPFSGAAVVEAAVARLREGVPVLLFPEGTRSPAYGLGEFRHGAFEIAARAGVPVIPLVVTCDPPMLLRGEAWYETPSRTPTMTIAQLPALRPPFGDARAEALALRAAYAARLPARPAGSEGAALPQEARRAVAR